MRVLHANSPRALSVLRSTYPLPSVPFRSRCFFRRTRLNISHGHVMSVIFKKIKTKSLVLSWRSLLAHLRSLWYRRACTGNNSSARVRVTLAAHGAWRPVSLFSCLVFFAGPNSAHRYFPCLDFGPLGQFGFYEFFFILFRDSGFVGDEKDGEMVWHIYIDVEVVYQNS